MEEQGDGDVWEQREFIVERVRLVWVYDRAGRFHPISNDVLRVIAVYLGDPEPTYLLGAFGTSVRLFDLKSGETRTSALDIGFSHGSILCPISLHIVLCVGGWMSSVVTAIDLPTYAMRAVKPLSEARGSPGVIKIGEFLYVFGGFCDGDLRTCEKYSLTQRPSAALPDMQSSRSMFSPCLYQDEVLLAAGEAETVEAFHIATERFRTVSVRVPYCGASVCFVQGEDLISLTMTNTIRRWRIGSEDGFQSQSIQSTGVAVYSSSPPIVIEAVCYFVDFGGNLTSYDLRSNELSIKR